MSCRRAGAGRPAAWLLARSAPLFAALGAALPAAAVARDINPEGTPVGQKAIALAGAVTALGGDGSALWYNPAGLGALPGAGISANLAVYSWRTQKIESFVDWGIEQGDADATSGDFASVPSSLVYALPLFATAGEKPKHGFAAGVFVPDDDAYDIRVSSQVNGDGGAAIQVKLSDTRAERSYWPGVGYGYDNGTYGIGFSGFMVAHTVKRQTVASIFATGVPELNGIAVVQSTSTTDVTALGQVGGLYRPVPDFTLALNIRTPSLGPLHQSGETLALFASDTPPAFLDRHESKKVEVEQRIPLRVAGGAAWQANDRWLLSLDLHFTAALSKYKYLDAPLLKPRAANGDAIDSPMPEERVLNVDITRKRNAAFNVALGTEVKLNETWALRGGFYTDMSTVSKPDTLDQMDYEADLFGVSLGVGMKGERGSTDVGILVRSGSGKAYSDYRQQAIADHPVKSTTDVEVFQFAFFLGGTADL